jgi:hypothetical protein
MDVGASGGRVGQCVEAPQREQLDAVVALLAVVGSYVGVKHLYDEGRLLDAASTPVRTLFPSLEVFGAALVVDTRFVLRPAPWNPSFRVVELKDKGDLPSRSLKTDPVLEAHYERQLLHFLHKYRSATVGSLGLAHPPPAELHTTCSAFVQARVDSGVFAVTRFTHSRRGATPQEVISLGRKAAQAVAKPDDPAARGSTSPVAAAQSPGLAAMRREELAESSHAAQPLTPLGSGMRRQRSDLDRLPVTLDDDDDGFGDALIDVGHFIGTPAALKAQQQQQQQRAGSSGGALAGEPSTGSGAERRGASSMPACRYGSVCRNFPACPFQHPVDMQAVVPQDRARPRGGGQPSRTPRRVQPPRSPLLVVYSSTSPYRTPEKKGRDAARSSRGAGESPVAAMHSPQAGSVPAASPVAQQQAKPRAPRKYAPPLL